MKKKAIIPCAVGVLVLSAIATLGTKDVESIKISFPSYQSEYDINTDIPVTITIFPNDATAGNMEYNTDSPDITFSKDGIHTGSCEGTYNVYVKTGDIQSNTLSITVVDMEARKETSSPPIEQSNKEESFITEAEEPLTQEVVLESQIESNSTIEIPESAEIVEPAEPVEPESAYDTQTAPDAVINMQEANPRQSTGNDSNFNTYNNTEQQSTTDEYILNTSTMKIHHPSCKSVPKIAPQNYATSNLSVNELINQGYSTCGNCFN